MGDTDHANSQTEVSPIGDTVIVTHEGDNYEFAIPSITDEIRIGMRMRDIRRRIDPTGDISDAGLDPNTIYYNRACAAFELMLRKSSAMWPFTESKKGPEIDCLKFPKEKAPAVLAVYSLVQEKILSFRK